eukprot:jgi/Chlat1/2106/Chrsp17S02704
MRDSSVDGRQVVGRAMADGKATIKLREKLSDSSNADDTPPRMLDIDGPSNAPDAILGGSATVGQCVMSLTNAVIGAGMLGLPFCYKQCGVIGGTLLLVICGVSTNYTMKFMALCAHRTGCRTYEDVAEYTHGKLARRMVEICVIALQFGCLVAYANILADVLSSVAGTVVPPGAEPSRTGWMAFVVLGVLFPLCCFVKSPQSLASISVFTIVFMFIFVVLIAARAFLPELRTSTEPLEYWHSSGLLVSFPVICFAFSAHPALYPIFNTLRAPSVSRMSYVISRTLVLCFICYVLVGALGYAAFREATAGDVLRNFNASGLTGLIKLGYGTAIVCTVPIVVIPLCDSLLSMFRPGHRSNSISGYELPNVEFAFAISGATASVLLSYILPSMIYLRVHQPDRRLGGTVGGLMSNKSPDMLRLAYALLVFGILAGLLCTSATLGAVKEEAEVVSLAKTLATRKQMHSDAAEKLEQAHQAALLLAQVEKEMASSLMAVAEETAKSWGLKKGDPTVSDSSRAEKLATIERLHQVAEQLGSMSKEAHDALDAVHTASATLHVAKTTHAAVDVVRESKGPRAGSPPPPSPLPQPHLAEALGSNAGNASSPPPVPTALSGVTSQVEPDDSELEAVKAVEKEKVRHAGEEIDLAVQTSLDVAEKAEGTRHHHHQAIMELEGQTAADDDDLDNDAVEDVAETALTDEQQQQLESALSDAASAISQQQAVAASSGSVHHAPTGSSSLHEPRESVSAAVPIEGHVNFTVKAAVKAVADAAQAAQVAAVAALVANAKVAAAVADTKPELVARAEAIAKQLEIHEQNKKQAQPPDALLSNSSLTANVSTSLIPEQAISSANSSSIQPSEQTLDAGRLSDDMKTALPGDQSGASVLEDMRRTDVVAEVQAARSQVSQGPSKISDDDQSMRFALHD